MTTESDRLLAAGKQITLSDGRAVRLRYSMRSLKMIEDGFGSTTNMLAVMESGEVVIGSLIKFLAAGLVGEGLTEDDLLDLLEPSQIGEYVNVAIAAFVEALPDREKPSGNGQAPETVTKSSPGAATTTSLPSDLAVVTPNSG